MGPQSLHILLQYGGEQSEDQK